MLQLCIQCVRPNTHTHTQSHKESFLYILWTFSIYTKFVSKSKFHLQTKFASSSSSSILSNISSCTLPTFDPFFQVIAYSNIKMNFYTIFVRVDVISKYDSIAFWSIFWPLTCLSNGTFLQNCKFYFSFITSCISFSIYRPGSGVCVSTFRLMFNPSSNARAFFLWAFTLALPHGHSLFFFACFLLRSHWETQTVAHVVHT